MKKRKLLRTMVYLYSDNYESLNTIVENEQLVSPDNVTRSGIIRRAIDEYITRYYKKVL